MGLEIAVVVFWLYYVKKAVADVFIVIIILALIYRKREASYLAWIKQPWNVVDIVNLSVVLSFYNDCIF